MAKAASKGDLKRLHHKVSLVFEKVLETYIKRLEVTDNIDTSDIEDDLIKELFNEGTIPNPAMLNAITAFLKTNEIMFETDEVGKISALQEALDKRRKQRSNIASLSSLKVVGDD